MSKPWPPPNAPEVNKAFNKAAENKKGKAQGNKPPLVPVTKKQIEKLEAERKTAKNQLHLTPPGMPSPTIQADRKREIELAKMKKKLLGSKGKARDDFNRVR